MSIFPIAFFSVLYYLYHIDNIAIKITAISLSAILQMFYSAEIYFLNYFFIVRTLNEMYPFKF